MFHAGNNIQHVSTISFSDSPKFNPEAVPFYPPTSMSSTTSISTDESSSLSSQNSGKDLVVFSSTKLIKDQMQIKDN